MKLNQRTYNAALDAYYKRFGQSYPRPVAGGDPELAYKDILHCLKVGRPTSQQGPVVTIDEFGFPDREY